MEHRAGGLIEQIPAGMRLVIVHELLAVGHDAGDPVVIHPLAAVGRHIFHALGHLAGDRVEVVPADMIGLGGILLALDHMRVRIETHPLAALGTVGFILRDEHVLVAGDGAVGIGPVPSVAVRIIEGMTACHTPVVVPVTHTAIHHPAVLRFGSRLRTDDLLERLQ